MTIPVSQLRRAERPSKRLHAREHDEPGVLDRVLGEGPVIQDLERLLAEPPLVAPNHLGLCSAVAGTKALDELELLLTGGEVLQRAG